MKKDAHSETQTKSQELISVRLMSISFFINHRGLL